MLQVENINYRIAPKLALRDISFEVMPGEVLVILGANGAGKSTLLKIITGSIKMDSGALFLNKMPLRFWQPKELSTFAAVLQQQHQLQLPFSVYEVVMMGRYPHFKTKETKSDEEIVASVLHSTGIYQLKNRNYLTLSGGEQQRVQLARVLTQVSGDLQPDARFLFMDEPSNNLDIRQQHSTLKIAKNFAQKGNCVVAVLHDLNLALQYADKIILLKDGAVKGYGKPIDIITDEAISEVYDVPLSVFHHPRSHHPMVISVS